MICISKVRQVLGSHLSSAMSSICILGLSPHQEFALSLKIYGCCIVPGYFHHHYHHQHHHIIIIIIAIRVCKQNLEPLQSKRVSMEKKISLPGRFPVFFCLVSLT